jgi:tetratricopeptide (TPR) repeat protein
MSNVAKLKKRALDYEQKKQLDKALDTYMQVLGALGDHVDEGDVALFNRVGDLLLGQGNVSAAVDHYERAVDLYSDGGFHNNAIALCKKILRNAPGRNSVYYKLGRISARKGFAGEAKTNFLEYADRMQRIGHVDEAFRALKEFADLCPDQDDIRLMLADQLVRGDRKEEAIEQLQLHYERLLAEGRAQEAKATLERIRAIDPSHEPKTGVMRPTPKANDLIFLDVGFDTPGTSSRPVTGSVPVVPATSAAPAATRDDPPAPPVADQPLPLIDVDDGDSVQIAPVSGLSSGSTFDPGADGAAAAGVEPVSQMGMELVTGFEETSLAVTSDGAGAIAPLAGLETSNPLAEGSDQSGIDALAEQLSPMADAAGETTAPKVESAPSDDDELQILDISLDLIDDGASEAGSELTLIFPDSESSEEWKVEAAAEQDVPPLDHTTGSGPAAADDEALSTDLPDTVELLASNDDGLRIEPLLQLPEVQTPDGSIEAIGAAHDLPLISAGQDDQFPMPSLRHEDTVSVADDAPSSATELHFLDIGGDQELPLISRLDSPSPATSAQLFGESRSDGNRDDDELVVASGSDAVATEPALTAAAAPDALREETIAPAEPTLADLRTIVELNPDDWESRRRLAEALLEAGDRDGGLTELEGAMLALERNGDLRGATAIVNEMIRVEPHAVRYHQKRVEYAVRSNDRSLLAEAYYSLAENLFQMGEIEKSRAVYARVLELSPGDPRARAALQTIDDAQDQESPTESTPEEAPEQTVDQAPPREDPALARSADHTTAELAHPAEERPPARLAADEVATELPLARGREPEPAPVARDFVNLAEWLEEDAPVRNTRMVVDVKEPEIEEQVDFAEMLSMFKQGVAANVDEADHEAHYDLGVAYKEMGLIDEAISEFQKALRGTEKRARTYEALGQCFVERGQHQIAVTILSRALGDKSYTDDMLVGVLYLLGYASESLGRWADAQRFYERVFAVDIEFRDVADRLAVAERAGK